MNRPFFASFLYKLDTVSLFQVTLWESLFFCAATASPGATHAARQRADRFLQRHPAVPRHLDADRALARARRAEKEEVFRFEDIFYIYLSCFLANILVSFKQGSLGALPPLRPG